MLASEQLKSYPHRKEAAMKKLTWLCLLLFCTVPTNGQHRGGFGGSAGHGAAIGGFGRGGFGRGFGSGGFGHLRFRSRIVINGFNHRFGFNRFSPFDGGIFYPYDYSLSGGAYDYGYPASPSIVIVQQPPQMIVQQAPREVVQTVIHDYRELPAAEPPASTGTAEQPTFVIALEDGRRLSASAVWVQGSTVHYLDSDDLHRELPLAAVDRQSTRGLNKERNLDLRLPAPNSQQ
jgi:hypothetical protein